MATEKRLSIFECMKASLESESGLMPFPQWFRENEDELEACLKRGEFLRLKHYPLTEFENILRANGVSFVRKETAYLPHGPRDCSWIKSSWLTRRVFPYQQSPLSLVKMDIASVDEFLHMVELKQTGDELWHFSSPSDSWKKKMGRAGIALVRDGKVVYGVITIMN